MTLSELVELGCTKMHRTDVESQNEIKVYFKARYRMLWDSRPWKDALALISINATAERVVILPGVVDRILCVRWHRTTLDPEHLITIFLSDPQRFEQVTNPQSYSIIAPSGVEIAPGGNQVLMFSDSASAAFTVTIHGMLGNVETREVVAMAGAGNSTSAESYDEIFSLSKTSTENALTVKDAVSSETLLRLLPEETSKMHQRIMFHSTPLEAKEIFVLYKRKCNDLVYDSDATQIRGIDNALLAAGISDMLEAHRHFSKAAIKAQESGVLTQAAVDLDVHQQANIIRIIPWEGFDSGEGELGGKGYL